MHTHTQFPLQTVPIAVTSLPDWATLLWQKKHTGRQEEEEGGWGVWSPDWTLKLCVFSLSFPSPFLSFSLSWFLLSVLFLNLHIYATSYVKCHSLCDVTLLQFKKQNQTPKLGFPGLCSCYLQVCLVSSHFLHGSSKSGLVVTPNYVHPFIINTWCIQVLLVRNELKGCSVKAIFDQHTIWVRY